MKQRVMALVGISGVGKTTFLKRIAAACAFQHLTAGSLIALAKSSDPVNRDSLRLSDLEENQSLLIRGFAQARDLAARVVILDCHVVVHGLTGLWPIESRVFSSLNVCLIAHLEADPIQIHLNRTRDLTRQRPLLSSDEIRSHQVRSLAEAQRVADDLRIEFMSLRHEDAVTFGRFVGGHV